MVEELLSLLLSLSFSFEDRIHMSISQEEDLCLCVQRCSHGPERAGSAARTTPLGASPLKWGGQSFLRTNSSEESRQKAPSSLSGPQKRIGGWKQGAGQPASRPVSACSCSFSGRCSQPIPSGSASSVLPSQMHQLLQPRVPSPSPALVHF